MLNHNEYLIYTLEESFLFVMSEIMPGMRAYLGCVL